MTRVFSSSFRSGWKRDPSTNDQQISTAGNSNTNNNSNDDILPVQSSSSASSLPSVKPAPLHIDRGFTDELNEIISSPASTRVFGRIKSGSMDSQAQSLQYNQDGKAKLNSGGDDGTDNNNSDGSDANGETFFGPSVVISRDVVLSGLVKLFEVFYLLSGFSFITCITICIFVNVGYVAFQTSGVIYIVVLAFTFFSSILFAFYRSLLGTVIRLMRLVWLQKFGGGRRDMFYVRWIDWIYTKATGKQVEYDDPHSWLTFFKITFLILSILIFVGAPLITVAAIYGYWTIINVFCALLTIVSAAFIILVNWARRILRFLNFIKNIFMGAFGNELVLPQMLVAYLASTGNDLGRNLVDVWMERVVVWSACIAVASNIFTLFRPDLIVEIVCLSLAFIAFVVRYRRRLLYCCFGKKKLLQQQQQSQSPLQLLQNDSEETLVGSTESGLIGITSNSDLNNNSSSDNLLNHRSQQSPQSPHGSEWDGHFYGERCFPQVLLVFVFRALLFATGFVALMYMDLTDVRSYDGNKPPAARHLSDIPVQKMINICAAFFGLTILKDLSFIFPMPRYIRSPIMFLVQCAQLSVAVYGQYYFRSFTFTASLILAIYELDYREGKWYWSHKDTLRVQERSKKRASRNACIILVMLLLCFVGSIAAGIMNANFQSRGEDANKQFLDLLRGTPPTTSNAQSSLNSGSNATFYSSTPMCTLKYTREDLTLTDLGIMSMAAYQQTREAALERIRLDPQLDAWDVGLYNLGPSIRDQPPGFNRTAQNYSNIEVVTGVRFIEFRHQRTNVSVMAIRGTQNLEDIFQDLYLWFTPFLLQSSSYFGTLINLWPVQTVSYTVALISNFASYPNLIYWGEMEKIVTRVVDDKHETLRDRVRDKLYGDGSDQEQDGALSIFKIPFTNRPIFKDPRDNVIGSSTKVMLTGHSMGGGLAFIIGAHLGIPAVGFSSPGLAYSSIIYKLTQKALMTQTVNIVPLNDPVPKFDLQISQVQNVPCDADFSVDCHSLDRTVVEIMKICGVPGRR
ncbi:hypothetical protein MP228_002397 [Amoeboaphelidium protococcarum]|nr:hypothetical protein MP228_002397 [Amoeboaphelidium protococcarum]